MSDEMNLSPEEQALIDSADEKNKALAVYLIRKDRAVTALKALGDLESMASAILEAVQEDAEAEQVDELIQAIENAR